MPKNINHQLLRPQKKPEYSMPRSRIEPTTFRLQVHSATM